MKRFCITCLIAVVAMPFWAQAPNRFPYYIEDTILSLMGDEIALMDSNEVELETLVPDTLPFAHPMPVFANDTVLKAPSRQMAAQASACPTDSVVGRDVNGNYVSLKTYRYDNAGRTIETAEWKWVDGVKTGVAKSENLYNGQGKKSMEASWDWDNNTKDWKGYSRKEYQYDEAGNTILYDILQWINGEWKGKTRYKYEYTAAGKTKWSEQYNFDLNADDWVGYTRSDYEYDEANRNTLAMTSNWSTASNAWVPQKKYIYEYDGTTANKTLDLYYSAYTASTDTWGGSGSTKKIATYYNSTTKKLLDEQYTWDTGKKDWKGSSKTEYEYNTKGSTTLTLKYKWDNTLWDWVYNTKSVTGYDNANRTTETASYTWKENDWAGSSRTTTAYTSSGQTEEKIVWKWTIDGWVYNTKTGYVYSGSLKKEDYSSTWSGSDWIKTSRKTYSYNVAGKNDTTITYKWTGTELVLSQRTYYVYDAKGNTIFTHNATYTDNKWKLSSASRLDLGFDDAGRQILNATWSCSSDSVWKGNQKDTANYSASGKTLFVGQYKYSNGAWQPSYEVTYGYDEQGRSIWDERFDWTNGVKKGNYRHEHEFNENGVEYITANYAGWNTTYNNWNGSSKTEKLFNDVGKQVGSISYTWRNNDWEKVFRYNYTYDSSNREIEQIIERYKDSKWVNDVRYEHEYSGSNEVKNNAYYWDDIKWVYSSRNEKTYDEDAAAKLRTELVASYSSGNLTSYDFKRYHYACDPHAFLIRFLNWDGSLISEQNFDAGVTPSCDSIPVRPANDSTSYTFKAWSPAISPVTEATTYTADYDSVTLAFPITFVNYDGSELQSEILAYGKIPTYEGPKPSKPANDSMTYTFKSWSPAIVRITQAATYTATFDSVRNQYTVTFKDADGTTLESKKWDYGATPTCTEPSKQPDAQYTYTFGGWDKTVVAVVADAEYTATYTTTTNQYTVTFKDADGTTLESKKWDYGATPTCTEPSKQPDAQYTYTFGGWDKTVVAVVADAEYTATYTTTTNQYTVTFKDADGTTLESKKWDYGATPTCTEPSKQPDAQYTYTFGGWDKSVVAVVADAEYTATYTTTTNQYTVTFKDADGTTLESKKWDYGATPTCTEPSKQPDAQYTYTFGGWDKTVVAVVADAEYTATYTTTTNQYTVTFKDADGTTLESKKWDYGATPTCTEPSKQPDAQYTYTFGGWDKTVVAVVADAEYTATYTSTVNQYTVTFKDADGTTLESKKWDYGATPTCTEPSKQPDAQYTYTFGGWDKTVVAVVADAEYTATYTTTTNQYTVTFKDADGTTLESKKWDYGVTPTCTEPSKQPDAQYTYTFGGWDKTVVAVVTDAEYTATYTTTTNQYTVTFKDADGTTLESKKWDYGATPTCTEPSKQPDAQYTYTFGGWDKTVVAVVADAEYTATYTTTTNQYTVTFKDADGTTLESKKWDYGATPTCTEPTKPADAQYSYSFKAWTPSVSDVTAEATYTAIYDTTAILYTVTFANYDGKVLQSQDYQYGATPKYTGTTPSRASNKEYAYTFKAWEPKIVPVTQNAVYTATYDSTEIESYVTILFLNYDSTLIYSQVVRYKRMPVYEGPTPTRKPSAHYTYTFKSWSPAISVALENTIYIAQYDSLTRYYSIRFVDYDGTILQSDELLYGETPFYRGAEPTREEDSEYTYTFDGWTPKIAPVYEDVAYVATYKAEPRNTADRHPYADGPDESKPMYNILGNPVDSHYRGIVIQGGRKFLR